MAPGPHARGLGAIIKTGSLARPSRDLVPLRDRLSRIQAIPGASAQISIGYPITSHAGQSKAIFPQIRALGANGISRRQPHVQAALSIADFAAYKGGCLNAADPFLEEPAREHRAPVRNCDHPLDGRRRRGRRLHAGKRRAHAISSALDSTALMLVENRGVANAGRSTGRGDHLLQRPVHGRQRQERHGHRDLFDDQRIAARPLRQRHRQNEFS